jgi:drug/metabolite transporter (DMT)-like permease
MGFNISQTQRTKGVVAALSSALFLGLAPVFGRMAILIGFSPISVVALRTAFAAALMFLIILIFLRRYLYIFPLGLAGCFLAGTINGFGSILYYLALGQLSASLGQLLYALYPLFVTIFSILDKQPVTKITIFRVSLAGFAVLLLINIDGLSESLPSVFMMIGSAILYALHIPINQRVLYEIPAPTVTLYTLIAMSLVTMPFFLFFDPKMPSFGLSWWPLALLTFVTFVSRITLFLGIKNIGGIQAAILGLAELFITIVISHYLLGEMLTATQLIGAGILGISLIMVALDKQNSKIIHTKGGWLSWIHPPEIKPWSLQD